jgi:hypothetical protein
MNSRKILPILLLLLITVALLLGYKLLNKSNKRNIKEFYFPTNELMTGKVYEYHSLDGDSTQVEYWYYRAFDRDSGVFLSATSYNRYFQIEQIVREKIVDNGALARDLFLYEPSAANGVQARIQAKIEVPNVFPFEVKDTTSIFLYKLNYKLPQDSTNRVFLIRNRIFGGDAPPFDLKGKSYPTIRLKLKEVFGSEGEGTAEGTASGEEWYAQGIGLVQFRKQYGEGENKTVRAFKLVDVYKMADMERKARAVIEAN